MTLLFEPLNDFLILKPVPPDESPGGIKLQELQPLPRAQVLARGPGLPGVQYATRVSVGDIVVPAGQIGKLPGGLLLAKECELVGRVSQDSAPKILSVERMEDAPESLPFSAAT